MGKRNEERVNTRSYERKKNLRKRKPIACKVKEPEKYVYKTRNKRKKKGVKNNLGIKRKEITKRIKQRNKEWKPK